MLANFSPKLFIAPTSGSERVTVHVGSLHPDRSEACAHGTCGVVYLPARTQPVPLIGGTYRIDYVTANCKAEIGEPIEWFHCTPRCPVARSRLGSRCCDLGGATTATAKHALLAPGSVGGRA